VGFRLVGRTLKQRTDRAWDKCAESGSAVQKRMCKEEEKIGTATVSKAILVLQQQQPGSAQNSKGKEGHAEKKREKGKGKEKKGK